MLLTGEEVGIFKANPELVNYVVAVVDRKPCARLVFYHGFAQVALESAERADLFAVQNQPGNPSLKPFVKNESFLESLTADLKRSR